MKNEKTAAAAFYIIDDLKTLRWSRRIHILSQAIMSILVWGVVFGYQRICDELDGLYFT